MLSMNSELELDLIDTAIAGAIDEIFAREAGLDSLKQAMLYSLQSGGKRFRPLLALLVAQAVGKDPRKVLPWAVAVEFIHTYSLIHDDLPAMDNDDFRRGKPTNHKVHGEGPAILAGDALLTEAFGLVARSYEHDPSVAIKLVRLLSECSGATGMVGGQVLDIETSRTQVLAQNDLAKIHRLKTGRLIFAAVSGAGVAIELDQATQSAIDTYGVELGFAFQVADDIEDYLEGKTESSGYPQLIGLDATRLALEEASTRARVALDGIAKAEPLLRLVEFNAARVNSLSAQSVDARP